MPPYAIIYNGDCVYIDVLLTVNIIIDFFLLLCVKRLLNIRAKNRRIILASVLGGVFSLIALIPKLPLPINLPIDILTAAALVFTAFGKCAPKMFFRRTAVYFAVSFSFCGIMVFIISVFHPKGMAVYNDSVYFDISPVLLIIITLISYYMLRIFKRITKGEIGKSTCVVEVDFNGQCESFVAAVDTGCNLREPFSGGYVIIAEKEILQNLRLNGAKMRIIPYGSLGGNGILRGYKPDYVVIDGKAVGGEVYLGVCENALNGEIKALVPFELMK